jgi:hypothetical protein
MVEGAFQVSMEKSARPVKKVLFEFVGDYPINSRLAGRGVSLLVKNFILLKRAVFIEMFLWKPLLKRGSPCIINLCRKSHKQMNLKMDRNVSLHLLQAMIDYFEAGNRETDAAAKAIIESDFENKAHWEAEIGRLKEGKDWTGLRAPEAEIVAVALRQMQRMLAERSR